MNQRKDEGRTPFSAVVLGSTGLVGKELVRLLAREKGVSRVAAVVRRAGSVRRPDGPDGARVEERVVDFESADTLKRGVSGDAVFCGLGTTIKKAGSQEAFRRVDYDYPVAAARAAIENGAKRFFLVSSIGAGGKPLAFYLRIKTELEEALRAMPFEEVHVFRPSFILGERPEKRAFERLGIHVFSGISPLLLGPVRKYRPVRAEAIAAAMVRASLQPAGPGFHVHESLEFQESR